MAPSFTDQDSLVLVNGFPTLVGFLLVYFADVRFDLEALLMRRV